MTTRHVKPARHPRTAHVLDTALALAAIVLTPLVEWFDDKSAEFVEWFGDKIAKPVAKWWKDLKGAEKVFVALRISVVLGCAVGAVIALAGCDTDKPTIPGHGTEPSAVRMDDLGLTNQQMAELMQVNPEGLAVFLNRVGR